MKNLILILVSGLLLTGCATRLSLSEEITQDCAKLANQYKADFMIVKRNGVYSCVIGQKARI